jgi:hypothetical protein
MITAKIIYFDSMDTEMGCLAASSYEVHMFYNGAYWPTFS